MNKLLVTAATSTLFFSAVGMAAQGTTQSAQDVAVKPKVVHPVAVKVVRPVTVDSNKDKNLSYYTMDDVKDMVLNGRYFAGGSIGRLTVITDSIYHDPTTKISEGLDFASPVFGIQGGAFYTPTVRASLNYRYQKKESMGVKLSNNQMFASVDYVPDLGRKYLPRPFVGISTGLSFGQVDLRDDGVGRAQSKAGLLYGVQTGVTWKVNGHLGLDVGYQYLINNRKYTFKDSTPNPNVVGASIERDYDIDMKKSKSLYLSINYLF